MAVLGLEARARLSRLSLPDRHGGRVTSNTRRTLANKTAARQHPNKNRYETIHNVEPLLRGSWLDCWVARLAATFHYLSC